MRGPGATICTDPTSCQVPKVKANVPFVVSAARRVLRLYHAPCGAHYKLISFWGETPQKENHGLTAHQQRLQPETRRC